MVSFTISVFNKCNNRCLMCTNPTFGKWVKLKDNGGFDFSFDAIEKKIKEEKKKNNKVDSIYLSGGEPTLHPQFFLILTSLEKSFFSAQKKLLTNGRIFFYKRFAQQTLSTVQKLELIVSICGPNARIHNKITRTKSSFEQMIVGLNNLFQYKKNDQKIFLRFVVSSLTKKYIFKTLDFVFKEFPWIDGVSVIFMEIEGHGEMNLKKLKIQYSDKEMQKNLQKSLLLFEKKRNISLFHFPLCVLPFDFWPFVMRTLPREEVTFLKKCQKCEVKKYCLGIPWYYLNNIKECFKEINPINLKVKKIKIISQNNFYQPIKKVILEE